jgi:hypothetical protein
MSQPRETTTNNLADVIQVIQIGHRTGTLTVERGEGTTFEEGVIVFVNGQIIDAKCGQQNGPVALGWLTTWTTCRFSFIVDASLNSQPPSYPQPNAPHTTTNPGLGSGSRSGSGPFSTRTNNSNTRSQTPHTNPSATNTNRSNKPNHFIVQTPYRIRTDNSVLAFIDQVGLTREHRRLFMLIDGQRTTQELVSLMGRNPEKVIELLTDLERAGIVYHS